MDDHVARGAAVRTGVALAAQRNVLVSSIPAGILTSSVLRALVLPVPRQVLQGFLMMVPRPPQCGQGCWLCITPNGVRCRVTT